MDNASIIRACQAIRACCDLLVDRHGNPVPMSVEQREAIVMRAEDYAARMDNGNRESYSDDMLAEICADDYVAETVRYYREQADNFMVEVAHYNQTCDICAAAGVGTPATRASVHRISGWMGNEGAHTAHICESCYAQLRVTALDGAIDEAVQGDFPAS